MMFKDVLGQDLTPGEMVVSIRNSHVVKMIVLKQTQSKVVTNTGAHDAASLLVITPLLAKTDPTLHAEMLATHGPNIIHGTIAPKTTVRYLVQPMCEIKDNQIYGAPVTHIGIFEIAYTSVGDRQIKLNQIKNDFDLRGFKFDSHDFGKVSDHEKRRFQRQTNWMYSYHIGSSSEWLSMKSLKELNIESLPMSEMISISDFNAQVGEPEAQYHPSNIK